ncbi:putative HhH-GPD family protein [Cryobacterium mesophilum]|uniref:Fe-S cluster assembly protein HesB n=1 Tax=Terrimesophilobacter mesophilus TaxID=433647 RepID=A0A4R8VD27_9MICO|nr:HhH-GPD-type base excision DNA repair protein [Terrimesophilobacter mesophilus]MBB5633281.1 putative HhH-GPD family protein [Terrimesophilobacter mesophilus]TFB80022.1 Fe-S cluster assembly protein HesB [Terrimesophilobacter mesophilus]
MGLHLTGDDSADALLTDNPFALLVGMLLDQQVPMETAFAGPAKLRDRLGAIDPATIAGCDPDAFLEAFRMSPAVHRFPASMATRVQALAAAVRDDWGGDTAAIWTSAGQDGSAPSGAEILRRLQALPGFGEQKAKIFLALLGKQLGLTAADWREASGHYGDPGSHRSIADVTNVESLKLVREAKKAMKAAVKKR